MAPVGRKPVLRPELLPGSGQPADVAVGAVRRGLPVLIRKQGEAMRTRNLSLPLLVSCLLAALLVATPIAQTQYVPNGPAIPTVALTGGGSPPPEAAPAPGMRDRPSQWNMEVLGHNDLQGRSAYQPLIKIG